MITPRIMNLILCESVGRGLDQRVSLYGIFARVAKPSFPAFLPYCAIYCRLGYGDGIFDLRFVVRGPDDSVVYSPEGACRVTLEDPLQTSDVALELEHLPLPKAGTYWIEVWIGEHRLPNVLPLYVDIGRVATVSG